MDSARLAGISLFAGLPEHELDTLASSASEVEFAEGEALTNEGDLGHCLFVIEFGKADVTSGAETLGEVGPGDVVGEIAVLSSGRRTASVVAKTPLRALRWFKTDVWALEGRAPESVQRLRVALDGHRA